MAHLALTRRAFLGTSAAAMGASALSSGVLAQSARFRRWEISDPNMPTTVLTSYKKAIGEMLKLPPTDPRNWYRNAFVHVFDCPHGNWWFLPWHRAYLGWLERTCRELSGDQTFALPYWDWTKSPRVPAAMFEDVLDPNNSQFIATFDEFKPKFEAPLAALYASFSQAQKDALSRRNFPATAADLLTVVGQRFFFDQPEARGLAAANPDLDEDTKKTVAIDMITDALLTPSFAGSESGPDAAGFASAKAAHHSGRSRKGILESEPHDNVHGAIGGVNNRAFMVSLLSSVDPIFFLHHGNLDRLWDVWTRRQAARGRPTLPQGADLAAWSDEQFLFFSDERGQPATKIKSGDYAAMSAFDYDYSAGSGEDQVPAPAIVAALPAIPTRSFSASITSRSLGAGEAARGVAEVPATALRAAAAPEASPPVAEITLNLSEADQGRRFRVQVTPAGGGSPITAGTITVFGEHGHHGPATFTVPLPKAPGAATAPAGTNVPLDISVVPIEPTGGLPRRAGPAAATARAASQPELAAIRVLTN